MLLKNKTTIEEWLENQNLMALKNFVAPIQRNQNRSNSWRSSMMISAHNLKHLLKIPSLKAECIMLNLEDGVSNEQKPYALLLAALALASNPSTTQKLVVRVNPLGDGGEEEIAYLNAFAPDAIRVPKIRTLQEVQKVLALVDEGIEVHLSIETKEAWLNLKELACHPRITVFYLGILDLYADLALSQTLLVPENPVMHYLLSHFLITSRACGVKAVSFVYQEYKNEEQLRRWLTLEKQIGLDAKGCISPNQVDLIHEVFGYSESDIARAKAIVELFEEHQKRGISGFVDERFGFIDEPIYKGALAILKR